MLPQFPHVASIELPVQVVLAAAVLLALLGGAALGWLVVTNGPIPAAALVVLLAGLVAVLSDTRAGLWATMAVVALLPFAVIPVRVGLTLTLFEAVSLATIGVWLLVLILHRNERLALGMPGLLVGLFLAVTLFAFLLGVGRAYTSQTFHDYGKFILAVLLFYVVWNTTNSIGDARRLVTALFAAGGLAAFVGLALYAGGPGVTLKVLSRLVPYGYPSSRIVRYIEDDPAKAMRLVSTSVDPNSFGGFLAVVMVLATSQAIARHCLVSRWLSVPVAGLSGVAVLLTQSRGAWVGVAAGFALLALLRYRWLIMPGAAGAAAVVLLGLGSGFIQRMWLGLTLQDPATKLRLAEYRNALAIIREHPLFGVGFGAAPSIDLQTGVSSIYLTIAERTGILGLVAFLVAVASIGLVGFRFWRVQRESSKGDLMLGLLAALSSALTVGVFDHYYFNITFPHMAALFWVVSGLVLALALPRSQPVAGRRFTPESPDVDSVAGFQFIVD